MNSLSFLDYLKDLLGDFLLDAIMSHPTLAYITVKCEKILEVSSILKKITDHLSMIAGIDDGTHFQLKYHFSVLYNKQQVGLSIEIRVPHDEDQVTSISSLYPGALFYELEIQEMFGIRYSGVSTESPFLLPDVFPDIPPLRKNISLEKLLNEEQDDLSTKSRDE